MVGGSVYRGSVRRAHIFEDHFRTRPRSPRRHTFLTLSTLIQLFQSLILSTIALPCSYRVPDVNDVVFDVPIEANNKDFIDELNKESSRRVRQVKPIYHPLRIHLHYDTDSITLLSEELQIFVNDSLLPDAVGYWTHALSVLHTTAPIRLSRKCISNHYYVRPHEKRQSCVLGCKKKTSCGEVIVPEEHLYQCRYCSSPNPQNCAVSGPADGAGVADTDFLLYVSAVFSERCKNADTVAYAAHCQQEADFDRPIAGHVNLCPNALSTQPHDQEVLLSTVKHEILHALGFSAGLYAFFRDDNGNPRTKRNRYNKPVSLNKERGYYDWDSNTIKTIIREDWWTADGTVSHPIHVMTTPRVRREARAHFNCEQLEGAELENQGGDGTALTHWEKRLFENEAMTGTHTQNPVYSRITLALLEDSGWYRADYSVAENLHWGKGLGCEFAQKSCGEWMKKQREKSQLPSPFCDEIKHDGKRSLATTRCTAQRDSLALCNLIPYRQPLPQDYRNFKSLSGVQADGVKHYGGSVELADFCPYNQEFEWKASNSTERRDSRCELEGNFAPEETNSILEVYGNQSGCFDLATAWTERKCSRIRTFVQYMAGCYQFVCANGLLYLDVFNGSSIYPCYHPGQFIHIKKIVNGWLREGVVICPPCEDFCRPESFADDDEYGRCRPPMPATHDYVGDPPLREPCAANTPIVNFCTVLLLTLSFFFQVT
uniref:Leishmanolysin-like peptidase n=1 Tax=Parascaris univalens TaxID=6257 RepID=A0A914ZU37_PARUN